MMLLNASTARQRSKAAREKLEAEVAETALRNQQKARKDADIFLDTVVFPTINEAVEVGLFNAIVVTEDKSITSFVSHDLGTDLGYEIKVVDSASRHKIFIGWLNP